MLILEDYILLMCLKAGPKYLIIKIIVNSNNRGFEF